MAETKSRSRKVTKPDTAEEASTQSGKTEAVATTNTTKGNNMSDAMGILEFSEDVGSQDAPVPLPAGDYTAEIRAAAKKTSATTGNDYVQVTFFIQPDQYPADYSEGDPDGQALTFNRVSTQDTPAGRYRLRKFLEAIGAKMGKSIDLNDWVGLTATVKVDSETYEGETRAVIKSVVAP